MIEFTSVIRMSEKQTLLSLDWANKKFGITYQDELHKDYLIDDTKEHKLYDEIYKEVKVTKGDKLTFKELFEQR